MKRTPIRAKRATPRRREAPRWDWAEWQAAGEILGLRSMGCCERCETDRGPFERHHRKRRRDGGDRLANILVLCRPCHAWVTEHPAEARKAGFIVSVSRDPGDVPVFWQRRSWRVLHDDGTVSGLFDEIDDAHG